jgi:hypothetical protein
MKAMSPDTTPQVSTDPRQPQFGAVLFRDERAGYLEQDVAREEYARPHPEHGRRETQVLVHRERRVPDVNAVEIGDDRGKK